ncbi:MAG: D-alanyl-D-alanine dipeptidase [Magnetovibrio sp.]|nr:D-alanyl-D-alanine dipeptidase [Magnetovibrio sp.]
MSLVKITEASHTVQLDLKYATADNFTGAPVYQYAACFLRPEAEQLLMTARDLALTQGWHLRIFDAFRPSQAQWKLWHHTPDPEFLADPRRGSPHSRGVAVDLTLIDIRTGMALDMGTGFDAFTPKSHHGNTQISDTAQKNRLLLMGLMSTAGWDFYRNEWWHYQMFKARKFDVLGDEDLPNAMTAP